MVNICKHHVFTSFACVAFTILLPVNLNTCSTATFKTIQPWSNHSLWVCRGHGVWLRCGNLLRSAVSRSLSLSRSRDEFSDKSAVEDILMFRCKSKLSDGMWMIVSAPCFFGGARIMRWIWCTIDVLLHHTSSSSWCQNEWLIWVKNILVPGCFSFTILSSLFNSGLFEISHRIHVRYIYLHLP